MHRGAPEPLFSPAKTDVSLSAQSLSTNGSNGPTLIFGDGDGSDGLLDSLEPLDNLRKILVRAGNSVTVKQRLPPNLAGFQTIWFVGIKPLSGAEQTELVGFVKNGGGLYLTGERNCCEASNHADEAIIDRLTTLRPTRVGNGADVDNAYIAHNIVNTNAIDGVGQIPNRLSSWQPSAPGVLSGLATRNALTFAYQGGVPVVTGEVWDGSQVAGGSGRLAILMDVNWLEANYWNAESAQGMALNLQRFLHGGDTHAQPLNDAYVALGDSYSAGEGNPRFEAITDTANGNQCHRSREPNGAYALIVEKALGNPSFAFVACSGSTIGNIWSGTKDPPQGKTQDPEPLQVVSLSSATKVVTLTVGGNDVGFADVLSTCIKHATECSADRIHSAPSQLRNLETEIKLLQAKLEATYKNIKHVASKAQIFVVGYPAIFPRTTPSADSCFDDTLLEHTSIEWLTERQTQLNEVVKKAAHNSGGVTWVDPNSGAHSFVGHDICSNQSWFIRPNNSRPTHYSFHPTTTGQENLAATLVSSGARKASLSAMATASSRRPGPAGSPARPRSVVPEVDPDASLSGTVTAAAGSPLAGVQVYVETGGNFVAQAETNPDGSYSVTGLAPGGYKAYFSSPEEYEPQWWDDQDSEIHATLVELSSGQGVDHIDAELRPDATLSGTVTATDGEPLAGAHIYASSTEGGPSGSAETAADGTYTVPGLHAGGYKVEFYLDQDGQHYETQWYEAKPSEGEAELVTLGHGEARQHIDAALAPDATLSGTVKATGGGPLSGVAVFAASDGGGYGSTTTNEDGTYTINGLPAGQYTVEFYANGQYYETQWYDGADAEENASAVTLTSGENRTGVDAELLADATLSGQVTAPSHQPLVGIEVRVFSTWRSFYAFTDESGRYEVQGLPAGDYRVEFYANGQYYETQWYDGKSVEESADVIVLTSGESLSGVNATLNPDATISGTVTAAGGGPLAGIYVYAQSTDGAHSGSATTTEDGTYTIEGLPAGDYKVEFYANGQHFETQWYDNRDAEAEADPVSLTSGQERTGIDAALRADATLSGTVSAVGGEPIGNALVEVRSTEGGLTKSAYSDPNGHYTVEGLPAGSYTIEFDPQGLYFAERWYDEKESASEATELTLSSGEAKAGVDAHLSRTAAEIKGRVTDSQGQPLADLEVIVTEGEGGIVGIASTEADGSYAVDGLQAGTYEVEFEPGDTNLLPQFYSEQDSAVTATPVSVASDSVANHIDAEMQPGATLAGTVTAADGSPLADVDVSVYDESGAFLRAVTSVADGTYAIPGLPAGTYTVAFVPVSSSYVGQFYDEASNSSTATPIVLAAGSTKAGIDARLADGATVEGTVTAAGGGPLEDVEVRLLPTHGGFGGTTVTDSEGDYAVTGLPPGDYTVQFVPAVGNYSALFYDNRSEASEADAITLSGGATRTGVDAALSPGASISGTITDQQTQAPVPGVQVSVEPAEDEGQTVTTTTGEDGSYSFPGLSSGKYLVAFEPDEAEYLGQYYDDAEGADSASAVSLQAGSSVEGIDAALTQSATVSGEVSSAKTGSPIAEAEVVVQSSADGGVVRAATTGEDGLYSVTGLPSGTYTVEFSAEGQNFLSQFYDGKTSIESAQTLTIAIGNDLTGVNAALAGGASIGGTVTDAPSGQSVGGVEVFAEAIEGGADGVATTAADGHYMIAGLSPGKYVVQFEPTESNDLGQFYDNATSAADAEPLTLAAEADRQGVDAALASGATISGTVTEAPSAAPLAGIEVVAYASTCNGGGTAMTDQAGHYEIQGIAGGTYHLVFNPSGGSYESEPYPAEIPLAANSHKDGVDGSLAGTSVESPWLAPSCATPLSPINLSPPSLSGAAIVGQTLFESHGTWSGEPTSYEYHWQRCNSAGADCHPIAAAASQTYSLSQADVGSTIRVQETAENTQGSGIPALSAPTAIVQMAAGGGEAPGKSPGTSGSGNGTGSGSGPAPGSRPKKKCGKGRRLKHGRCVMKKKKHHKHH